MPYIDVDKSIESIAYAYVSAQIKKRVIELRYNIPLRKEDLSVMLDHMSQQFVVRLQHDFAQREFTKFCDSVVVPLTWWDAFKLRYFSARMLKWWPAQTKEIPQTIHRIFNCPHMDIPSGQKHVNWLTFAPEEKDYL